MRGREFCQFCKSYTPVNPIEGYCDYAPSQKIPYNGLCKEFEDGPKLRKISFTVPGEAVPQCRPRFRKNGGRPYQTEKVINYKQLVTCLAQEAIGDQPLLVKALSLEVNYYTSVPTSASKKKRALMLESLIYPTKKPDCDNVVKGLMDGMNKVVYQDDAQIVELVIHKRYDEKPRLEVTLRELGDRA